MALGFLGTILAGTPLMFLTGPDFSAMPLLTALVVFPSVAIVAVLLWVLRTSRIPEIAIILMASVLCGTAAGIIFFSAMGPDWWIGPIVTVPIALVVATAGYGLDKLVGRSTALANASIIVGAAFLLGCAALLI